MNKFNEARMHRSPSKMKFKEWSSPSRRKTNVCIFKVHIFFKLYLNYIYILKIWQFPLSKEIFFLFWDFYFSVLWGFHLTGFSSAVSNFLMVIVGSVLALVQSFPLFFCGIIIMPTIIYNPNHNREIGFSFVQVNR